MINNTSTLVDFHASTKALEQPSLDKDEH